MEDRAVVSTKSVEQGGENEAEARRGACESVRAATPARRPDFFIVGHQKCGTTALYLMLQQHPQIFLSSPKEPRFFASDLRMAPKGSGENLQRPRDLDSYLALFAAASAEQIAGEASAWYLRSAVAAAAIAELQPAARIVAIVREPVSYLRSFHLQMLRSHQETQKDFRRALALEPLRREGRRIPRRCPSPPALWYSEHVRYVEQLSRYDAVFSREQLLVLIYDDFRDDNAGTVRTVSRFLGASDDFPFEVVKTEAGRSVRSVKLRQLIRAARMPERHPEMASPFGRVLSALVPRGVRENSELRSSVYRALSATPQKLDEELVRDLRRRFRPEVEALGAYLGRDLVSLWGYDRID